MMLRRAGSRSAPSAPRRGSPQRSPLVRNLPRPPQPIDREGRVAIGLTFAIHSFPLLASCARAPTVSHLERIGELASARIHVTDILMADGEGFRGAWLIKGDTLLACDVSRAKILNLNPTA